MCLCVCVFALLGGGGNVRFTPLLAQVSPLAGGVSLPDFATDIAQRRTTPENAHSLVAQELGVEHIAARTHTHQPDTGRDGFSGGWWKTLWPNRTI